MYEEMIKHLRIISRDDCIEYPLNVMRDCKEAAAAIEMLEKFLDIQCESTTFWHDQYESIMNEFKKIHMNPNATVKRGMWILEKTEDMNIRVICSCCLNEPLRESNSKLPNYCPNCGSCNMRSEEEKECD